MAGWMGLTLAARVSRSQNAAGVWSCQNGYFTTCFTWSGETPEGVKRATPCKGALSCEEQKESVDFWDFSPEVFIWLGISKLFRETEMCGVFYMLEILAWQATELQKDMQDPEKGQVT